MPLVFYMDDVEVTDETPNEARVSYYAIQLALTALRTDPRYQGTPLSIAAIGASASLRQEFENLFFLYRVRLTAAVQTANASQ